MIEIGLLKLDTDFEYRIIREENDDVDIFIDYNDLKHYKLIKNRGWL